ncbi:MAG: NYN domain-containing protein [Pseudomonadota bacterium]
MLIAVDGYNFIKQSPELRRLEQIELQRAREGLLEQLRHYKRLKGHSFIVVFDGRQEGRWAGHRERIGGIDVIFSKPGEKADEVLKRLASEKRGGITVVTSDRDVASFAEKKGAATVSAADWAEKMEMAQFYAVKGGEEEPSAPIRSVAPAKKGPAHRLPKAKRKATAIFKKL